MIFDLNCTNSLCDYRIIKVFFLHYTSFLNSYSNLVPAKYYFMALEILMFSSETMLLYMRLNYEDFFLLQNSSSIFMIGEPRFAVTVPFGGP